MIIQRVIPIPDTRCKGFTIVDVDGNYNIYINANLSYSAQLDGLKHELIHIKRGDFDKSDVQQIEHDAHRRDA